ncbi:MAG: hypothetical protein GF331_05945, partial [Chitinivibrionales bacterium]|nr:hypothetical protein [Chitinivibrionales bacterium]
MFRYRSRRLLLAAAACALAAQTASPLRVNTSNPVVTGPRGVHPYVIDGVGKRAALAPKPGDPDWSLLAHSRSAAEQQTLHIVAFMVEFNGGQPDSTDATTGTGLFNIWELGTGTANDVEEAGYYDYYDGKYAYDNLDHYQDYFARQFDYAKTYYERVSNGRFRVEYDIFPREYGTAYHVDKPMASYSPGGKYPKESWDEYYLRRTEALMQFIVDAVGAAATQQGAEGNPFELVASIDADGTPRDSAGNPIGFMVIHAGASYLTDGGENGVYGADSPSDMIDAFISPDFFTYFRDELSFDSSGSELGVRVQTGNGEMLVNEVMMLCETSNQDGLNWGIHGILINQIARQIGLPDLFSTSSGISGIGAFCIMDFAGYSAAKGFVPPWPSAWVRAFMGWDKPRVAPMGESGSYRVKALGTDSVGARDTTILLVPINDHEYFLIENRQRNPERRSGVFEYDTTEDGVRHLASYPYNTNISAIVADSSGRDSANTILDVYHYDIGLPASGVLVWHIDEEVIRRRLQTNLVNADSLYRGISLVEADGIEDLGIQFEDAFYQAAFDWGG